MKTELDATKAVLGELSRHLDVDIAIELWDGTIVRSAPMPRKRSASSSARRACCAGC